MPRRSSTGSEKSSGNGRLLHIEAFSGMAGNMFTGALLDLGLPRKQLVADLSGLGVEFKLKVSRVQRGALSAAYVHVGVPDAGRGSRRRKTARRQHAHAEGHALQAPHAPHRHGAQADHDEAHDRDSSRTGAGQAHHAYHEPHSQEHAGSYRQIVELLERADLRDGVRARALAIFEALGRAESRVHGVALDQVHFHEVGAVDAIVDVTAAAIGLDRLGIERMTCSPVALGHGSVDTAHGLLPLPAPATLELLKGIPTVPAHVEWETVTPTGAAILRALVDEFVPLPAMTVEQIGYGAGNDRKGPMPNVVRAIVGRSNAALGRDRVVLLETNLDDLVPEHFDFLMERLFEEGALDVSLQNIQMKKNRPGFLVRVIGRPSDRQHLARILFAESSAIGVRSQEWDRLVLRREGRRVDTPYGRIRVKIVQGVEGDAQVSAEYDDCRRAARKAGVPLRDVVRSAEECGRERLT
jgi:uncharacterized protein (TIGR00299 family) protein